MLELAVGLRLRRENSSAQLEVGTRSVRTGSIELGPGFCQKSLRARVWRTSAWSASTRSPSRPNRDLKHRPARQLHAVLRALGTSPRSIPALSIGCGYPIGCLASGPPPHGGPISRITDVWAATWGPIRRIAPGGVGTASAGRTNSPTHRDCRRGLFTRHVKRPSPGANRWQEGRTDSFLVSTRWLFFLSLALSWHSSCFLRPLRSRATLIFAHFFPDARHRRPPPQGITMRIALWSTGDFPRKPGDALRRCERTS